MAKEPKTLEGIRKTLGELAEEICVSLNVHIYETRGDHLYISEDWDARIKLESEGIEFSVSVKNPGKLVAAVKAKLASERKHKAEQKRIAHQPKLLEYRPA